MIKINEHKIKIGNEKKSPKMYTVAQGVRVD